MSKPVKKTRTRTKTAATIPPFLHKIFEILENPQYNEMISWNDEGNAFLIKNVTDFTELVLPKYFKHNNFASFVRQLNLYDFHKSQYNNNGSEFYHKNFRRGEKELLLEIKRKIPNEASAAESPAQIMAMVDETESTQGSHTLPSPNSLQDIITRQERLEEATKLLFTQNKNLVKENKMLWNEVLTLKNKQVNTEKATKTINNQNTMLLKENRYLWNEFVVHREKYERQVEKLMLFLISIIRNSGGGMYKKGGSTKLNQNNQEEEQFDAPWPGSAGENENFSVLPVKRIAKQFANKKTKSQLDKLLERLEDDGIANLLNNKPFVLDDKDLLGKFKTMLDLDINTANFPTLDFSRDKRAPMYDHNIDHDDSKERLSKLCKIENDDNIDSALAVIREEKTLGDRFDLPKLQTNHSGFGNDRLIELASPMRLEEDHDFHFGSAEKKGDISLDNDMFFDHDHNYQNNGKVGIPMSFPEIKNDDDDDSNGQHNKLLEKSFSELDIHPRVESRNDNLIPWFDPMQQIHDNLNMSSEGKDHNYFFNSPGGNMNKLDQSF